MSGLLGPLLPQGRIVSTRTAAAWLLLLLMVCVALIAAGAALDLVSPW